MHITDDRRRFSVTHRVTVAAQWHFFRGQSNIERLHQGVFIILRGKMGSVLSKLCFAHLADHRSRISFNHLTVHPVFAFHQRVVVADFGY